MAACLVGGGSSPLFFALLLSEFSDNLWGEEVREVKQLASLPCSLDTVENELDQVAVTVKF